MVGICWKKVGKLLKLAKTRARTGKALMLPNEE